jgi:Tfp pilus assembly major pilin PilA
MRSLPAIALSAILVLLLGVLSLTSCAPSQAVIETAIAQTALANSTDTPRPADVQATLAKATRETAIAAIFTNEAVNSQATQTAFKTATATANATRTPRPTTKPTSTPKESAELRRLLKILETIGPVQEGTEGYGAFYTSETFILVGNKTDVESITALIDIDALTKDELLAITLTFCSMVDPTPTGTIDVCNYIADRKNFDKSKKFGSYTVTPSIVEGYLMIAAIRKP